ncbi:DBH-like monooxygenase protein 2 isoform X2 [Ambystoma mexicanum]|uniref:DBH-like monooxygenase protein 2 isoform X2 n=1 Tax=Ambystoma mexicanum TaxID=8296 RepID=UPI0037E8FCDD
MRVRHVWFLFCGLVPLVPVQPLVEMSFSTAIEKDGCVILRWGVDRSAGLAVFEVQAQTTGWLGFGLSPGGGMAGADIVIGGVFPNKTVYFSEDAMHVIAAYGTDDRIGFHNMHRSSTLVYLLSPEDNRPSLNFSVMTNEYSIPTSEITYACTFVRLPTLPGKRHIYKFEPVLQTGHEEFIQSMVLHACNAGGTGFPPETENCGKRRNLSDQCVPILVSWTAGEKALYFPDNAGISLGAAEDPAYVMLKTHYSNLRSLPEVIDSSGIRLHYTPELRAYDVGTLTLGPFTDEVLFIPPRTGAYKVYGLCKTGRFTELDETIKEMQVFASLLQTHAAGRAVQIAHFRQGSQMGFLGREMHHDFSMQRTRLLRNVTAINMGDDIIVECTYNTLDRANITYGGLGSRQEKCLGLLYYYPRGKISGCFSYTDLEHVAKALGKQVSSTQEAMLEIAAFQWDEVSVWMAEKANKESSHIVYIQNNQNEYASDVGPIFRIQEPADGNITDSSNSGRPCTLTSLLPDSASAPYPSWYSLVEVLLLQASLIWLSKDV